MDLPCGRCVRVGLDDSAGRAVAERLGQLGGVTPGITAELAVQSRLGIDVGEAPAEELGGGLQVVEGLGLGEV